MMKNKLKQLIALILAMSMCLSLLSANVWAAEESDPFVDEDASIQSSEGEGSADELGQAEDTSPDGKTESAEIIDEEPEDSEPELEVQASKSGKCGKNLTWSLDSKGTLTIQGEGKMSDFENNPPWNNYLSTIKKVVIKSGVTSIGAYAFVSSDEKNFPKKLEEVSIPSTVTRIGDGAFGDIGSLKTVNFPKGLSYVGTFAFMGCQLTNISLPNSVTTIGDSAFAGCAIKKITIPSSVKKMGTDVFGGCEKLEQVIFAEGSTFIGDAAFSYCEKLSTVSIPNSLTTVKEDAFLGCKKLTSVTIPRGVTSIGKHAFGFYLDDEDNYKLIKGFSITGYVGSAAEKYSSSNKIRFNKMITNPIGWSIKNINQSFGYNDNYHFPLQTYGSVFGVTPSSMLNALVAKTPFGKWGGNCFGMSLLAGSSYMGIVDLRQYFVRSGDCLCEYGYDNIEKYESKEILTISGNKKAINAIEKAHISQLSSQFLDTEIFKNDNNYVELINYLKNTRNSVLILFEVDKGGHAVVFDNNKDIVELSDSPGIYYIPIYDPNVPLGKNLLKDPHPWYELDENYILLNTNDGKYTYKGSSKSYRGDHKFFNHRQIRFFDLSRLQDNYFNSTLSIAFNPNDIIFGFDSSDINVSVNGEGAISISNGSVVQLNNNYDYNVLFDGIESQSDAHKYMDIKKDSLIEFTGTATNAVVSNADGAFTINTTSDVKVSSEIEKGHLEVTSVDKGTITVSYCFINGENTVVIDECTTTLSEGESVECDVDQSISFSSKDNALLDIRHYEYDSSMTNQKDRNTIKVKTAIVLNANAKKNQSFNLNASANGAKLSYKSNNKNVTVKNGKVTIKKGFVGKATITITSAATDNYLSATKKVTVTVNPSTTQISSVKWDKKKKIANIVWKKNTTGKGYELQCSTNKNFKKNVKTWKIKDKKIVKATIKGLKKGTYYLRIRTVNGKCYSKWSKTKTTKISK